MNATDYKKIIKGYLATGLIWTLLATVAGLVNQLQLFAHIPANNTTLGYGILRPIFTTVLIFGGILSFYFAIAYSILDRLDSTVKRITPVALGGFVLHNLAIIIGIGTIILGFNKGREYGEMTWISDNLLFLAIGIHLVGFIIATNREKARELSLFLIFINTTAMAIVFILGNFSLPHGPFHSTLLYTGLQNATIQEIYRTGVYGVFLVMPLFTGLYYYLPAHYQVPLFSEKTAQFHTTAVLILIPFAGAAGLVFSAAPTLLQSTGIVAAIALSVAILSGAANLNSTLTQSEKSFQSDTAGLFMRWGVFFIGLLALMKAITYPRFMQEIFGYTTWNVFDLGFYAQFVAVFVIFGLAYSAAQRSLDRKLEGSLSGKHLLLGIAGIFIVLFSDFTHGLIQGIVTRGEFESYTDVLFAGAILKESTTGAFFTSLRGLSFIGYLIYFAGLILGTIALIKTITGNGSSFEEPDLSVKEGAR